MQKSLDIKLARMAADSACKDFILADAKDADMAFGIASPGCGTDGRLRSLVDFREQMGQIVRQGLVDIMLMSASSAKELVTRRVFEKSVVTPAARANDSTDIHIIRHGAYAAAPSRPFASATIEQLMGGRMVGVARPRRGGVGLGLYSVTFNNLPAFDLATMEAYKHFRVEAEVKEFAHFLEIFDPNVPASVHGIAPGKIGEFVNDHVVRLLAAVQSAGRPRFLKMVYHGPAAMEELRGYDPSLVIGVLGGAAGTCHDAFSLLHEAKGHGARAALFGRHINAAEHQLSFVEMLRRLADGDITPPEAVKAYHGALGKLGIKPRRKLERDLELTLGRHDHSYGAGRRRNANDESKKRTEKRK